MAATKRARARAQRIVFRRLGKPKSHMNVAAVAAAQMVHVMEATERRLDVNGRAATAAELRNYGDSALQHADPIMLL